MTEKMFAYLDDIFGVSTEPSGPGVRIVARRVVATFPHQDTWREDSGVEHVWDQTCRLRPP